MQTDGTESAYCISDGSDSAVVETYGLLYNWYAANDNRNIAPEGWRVPTDEDWKELEIALGMSQEDVNDFGTRGTAEGGALKEEGTVHWLSPNAGATNESGFTALPDGHSNLDGVEDYLNRRAHFWSSTESGDYGVRRKLAYINARIQRDLWDKRYHLSIRCVRD